MSDSLFKLKVNFTSNVRRVAIHLALDWHIRHTDTVQFSYKGIIKEVLEEIDNMTSIS